ncbi:unnamed protein product [Litomosoides sigmodontis]|uniref:Phospholipase A2 domain-containing protein n=1 Tax=Litomosoides sigmodontis TaxID=42156 RepID=A0A3P6T983_LITSI|nr:unnamed protein product [Litomosoides sigmodontis]
MLLLAGIMLVCGARGTFIESEPMPVDPQLLRQIVAQLKLSAADEDSSKSPVAAEVAQQSRAKRNDSSSEVEVWECGVDNLTKYISKSKIERTCPQLKKPINQCCITHDECYDEQRGREFCDDTFCECLNVATQSSPVCNRREGRSFCEIVRHFGELAYIKAGRHETMDATKMYADWLKRIMKFKKKRMAETDRDGGKDEGEEEREEKEERKVKESERLI